MKMSVTAGMCTTTERTHWEHSTKPLLDRTTRSPLDHSNLAGILCVDPAGSPNSRRVRAIHSQRLGRPA